MTIIYGPSRMPPREVKSEKRRGYSSEIFIARFSYVRESHIIAGSARPRPLGKWSKLRYSNRTHQTPK